MPAPPREGPLALPGGALLTQRPEEFFAPTAYRRARPHFVVEIGAAPCFAAAREILAHARIPMARLFDPMAPHSASLRAEACARNDGVIPALLSLDHLARQAGGFRPVLEGEAGLESAGNAGWAALLAAIGMGAENPSA